MLYNLVIMLQRLKRHEESREIIRHAVQLRHEERLYEEFRLWAAFEEAISGNLLEAEAHLAALAPENVKEHNRPLQIMARLLVDFLRKSTIEKKCFLGTIRKQLPAAFGKGHPAAATQYVRDSYKRFISVVSSRSDGIEFRLWGWWQYRGAHWLWIPGILVCLLLGIFVPPLLVASVIALFMFLRRQ
jgi:hypothetical protein